ncbi:pyridoxamine 5'-phosphate oxidase family protein [Streptomyces sp. GLT-R25]
MTNDRITEILNRPLSRELLARDLCRLAYVAKDGTPRNIPIAFAWNGKEAVMCTSKNAPKLASLRENPAVAITIDTEVHPPKILLVRGTVELDEVEGIPEEYLEMNGSYGMTGRATGRVGGRGPLALRRHGPHRDDADVGQADRLRDDLAQRSRGTRPAARGTSAAEWQRRAVRRARNVDVMTLRCLERVIQPRPEKSPPPGRDHCAATNERRS